MQFWVRGQTFCSIPVVSKGPPLELGEGSLMPCYDFSIFLSVLLAQSRRPGLLLWAGGR